MARLARVVVAGTPHHVTQRGNGGAKVFFSDADYELYLQLLREALAAARVVCLAYVLMPNHVHLILVPKDEDGLRKALSRVHRAYAGILNARRKRSGHFWQGRFGCVAMDGEHCIAALRYVLLNPVRAKLCAKPLQWPWSSAGAYLKGISDGLTETRELVEQFPDMKSLLSPTADPLVNSQGLSKALRKAESIGRPLGGKSFMERLERKLERPLAASKRGPKAKVVE